MTESTDAQEWGRIVRAAVKECLETWRLQAGAAVAALDEPAALNALDLVVTRASVPILAQLKELGEPGPSAQVAVLVKAMLAAFVLEMPPERRP